MRFDDQARPPRMWLVGFGLIKRGLHRFGQGKPTTSLGNFKHPPIKNDRNRIRILFQYLATLCDSYRKIGQITSTGMKHPQFSAFSAKSKSCVFVAIVRLLVVASLVPLVATSIASEPLAKGIQDNSFFIEEAYNQEAGVVQHILNVPINFINGSREITPSFTQEWPVFSQMHQFSYTIPYAFTEDDR